MQINKITYPLVFTVLLSCTAPQLAKSVESITTVTTTTDAPVTATVVPGSIVYLGTTSPTVLITTIEGRRKDLEKMINEANSRGEISNERCAAMKRELNRIAKQTGSNTISYPVAVMSAQDLDSIGEQYKTVVTTGPAYVPIIVGSRLTIYTGQSVQLDDLSMRRANLESRITKALFQGRLTDSRANELRNQLSNIGSEASLYTANGTFDAKESRRLYDQFDHVASEIEKSAGKDNSPQ